VDARDRGAVAVGARDPGALRVHDFMARSRANGPGVRAVLWLQGCSLGCSGCFNPATHPRDAGERASVDELVARVAGLSPGIEGITISGGEPLEQARPLRALLERLRRETPLSVILFTGFTWEEATAAAERADVLPFVDVLVAGRYAPARRLARGLRGSDNKTTHFLTDRYADADLEAVPAAEIAIGLEGEIVVTGMDPPDLGLRQGTGSSCDPTHPCGKTGPSAATGGRKTWPATVCTPSRRRRPRSSRVRACAASGSPAVSAGVAANVNRRLHGLPAVGVAAGWRSWVYSVVLTASKAV